MSNTDAVFFDAHGVRSLYIGPELRESLPPVVLEGLTRRRLVALGEVCPCGARLVMPSRAERRAAGKTSRGAVWSIQVEHEDDCPAICPELLRWVQ